MKSLKFVLAATVRCARGPRVQLMFGLLAPGETDVAGRHHRHFHPLRCGPSRAMGN
jgi:hypothetical protein